jgi:uncharacterized protein YjbI with pentapeptide repeats
MAHRRQDVVEHAIAVLDAYGLGDLSMSDLTSAVLREANLEGATVRGTTLVKADLRGAMLGGVDLREATLKDTRLDLAGAVHLAEIYGAVVEP